MESKMEEYTKEERPVDPRIRPFDAVLRSDDPSEECVLREIFPLGAEACIPPNQLLEAVKNNQIEARMTVDGKLQLVNVQSALLYVGAYQIFPTLFPEEVNENLSLRNQLYDKNGRDQGCTPKEMEDMFKRVGVKRKVLRGAIKNGDIKTRHLTKNVKTVSFMEAARWLDKLKSGTLYWTAEEMWRLGERLGGGKERYVCTVKEAIELSNIHCVYQDVREAIKKGKISTRLKKGVRLVGIRSLKKWVEQIQEERNLIDKKTRLLNLEADAVWEYFFTSNTIFLPLLMQIMKAAGIKEEVLREALRNKEISAKLSHCAKYRLFIDRDSAREWFRKQKNK